MPKPGDMAMPRIRRQEGSTLIVLGPGAVDGVRTYLADLGAMRAYLVTGASLASGPVGERVRGAIGDMLVGAYGGSRPHVPSETMEEVVQDARASRADILIGLGGGSPIGTAKAAVFQLQESGGSTARVPWIVGAIPTTYSGSEVTPVFGTTDVERHRKSVLRSDPVRPRLALYAKDAGDDERTMALRAAGRIVEFLPRTVRDPRNLLNRYRMFEGSMEAGLVLAKAGMGVHHGLCHVLGGRYNAP